MPEEGFQFPGVRFLDNESLLYGVVERLDHEVRSTMHDIAATRFARQRIRYPEATALPMRPGDHTLGGIAHREHVKTTHCVTRP